MVLDVRQKQKDCIARLLQLNNGSSGPLGQRSTSSTPGYKVLVLDKFCKDLLSPLLRVNDLRKHGVTLHLGIESSRQPIQEVPAVYLVQPTSANISAIVGDASSGLYDELHLNFVSHANRNMLEELAQGMVKAHSYEKIAKIYDQYLAFVSLEKGLFSLGLSDCYMQLNDPSAKDTQIEACVASVVDGLFCVFVTLGVVPIIHCPKGGAAEHIASALDEKIRGALKSRNNLFSESSGTVSNLSRPLLILFERNFDLTAAIQHTWSYKPLVQDVLGLHLNRIVISNSEASDDGPKGSKDYDVDEEDFFWQTCGSHPFPKVAEEVEIQLQNYRKAVEDVNKKTAAQALAMQTDDAMRESTQNLMSAVSSLPELTEKKKVIDKHTNIATALLENIKNRAIDQFYNLEEDVLSGKAELGPVLEVLNGDKGSPSDKLRLALVYMLAASPFPSDGDLSQIESSLNTSGADTTAFSYVRTLCKNNLAGNLGQSASGASITGTLSQGNLLSWADKTFTQGLNSVTKSVKNLLSGARKSPVVAVVESLMDGKGEGGPGDGFKQFDPKAVKGAPLQPRHVHREAIVFAIGGGNYQEREAVELWAMSGTVPKQIVYGTTDVVAPERFVQQLGELARRMPR